ncbi:MAG: cytochrome C [Flavobacterium sp.]|uniref:c-type cytochrome n=1 Tax=Flavobacterium sp. TaxID=239 RepID=UPI000C433C60|nr:cytochrome c [Flavobacterium sp.]MBF02020.1 cytochrome C [Flavobacterium sp.]|tara:strand:- start:249 stop:794 length:546 start_codon:yes stop_codon:yes gene_type:complete
MKSLYKIVAIAGFSFMVTSCHDDAKPNYQFFPNMYEAVPYETYSEHEVFKNGKEGQLPAPGTIKRGFVPYEIPNTTEGYALAKETLKSPLDSLSRNPENGKALFNIYCAICHGEKGDGKGNLVKREKFLGVPSYKDREITEGSIYHVVTYGLNSMGSHANQLTQEERWQVADYVLKLKSEL